MAEPQPDSVVEGATTGDIEVENPPPVAKSGEDRKAASALAKLGDSAADDQAPSHKLSAADHAAVTKAMQALSGAGPVKTASSSTTGSATAAALGGNAKTAQQAAAAANKNIKVDQADVSLLVDELEVSKVRATELLRAHEGNAVEALRSYVAA